MLLGGMYNFLLLDDLTIRKDGIGRLFSLGRRILRGSCSIGLS